MQRFDKIIDGRRRIVTVASAGRKWPQQLRGVVYLPRRPEVELDDETWMVGLCFDCSVSEARLVVDTKV